MDTERKKNRCSGSRKREENFSFFFSKRTDKSAGEGEGVATFREYLE